MTEWKDKAIEYGWRIIKAAGDNPDYYPYVKGGGKYKYLYIMSASKSDAILTIQAPTYRDLMCAARDAWNTYTFVKRGF